MFKTVRLIDLEIDKTTRTSKLVDPKALEHPTLKYRVEVDSLIETLRERIVGIASPLEHRAAERLRGYLQTGSIELRLILAQTSETDRRSNDR
jgi:hypothetical protein